MIPVNSTDAPAWLTIALKEIGVAEGSHDARILQYRAATKLRPWAKTSGAGSAWCADFACWVLEQSGVNSPRSAAAASFGTWGRESHPIPGAVILFGKKDVDAASTGHVGFIVEPPVKGRVVVVSGNCSNAVKLKTYRVLDAVAVRWPEFP